MIMLVRIVVGEEVISFISAYGPQVKLDKEVKCVFWENLGDLIDTIVGSFGYGVRNESGEILLAFALVKESVVFPNCSMRLRV